MELANFILKYHKYNAIRSSPFETDTITFCQYVISRPNLVFNFFRRLPTGELKLINYLDKSNFTKAISIEKMIFNEYL